MESRSPSLTLKFNFCELEKENERILNKILIANGGVLNLDTTFKISDFAKKWWKVFEGKKKLIIKNKKTEHIKYLISKN